LPDGLITDTGTEVLSLTEAREKVLEAVERLPAQGVALADAAGLVLAETCVAPHDLPRFDNSSMDGYALRAEDALGAAEDPVTLTLAAEARAGQLQETPVVAGQVVRIMTGAPLPPGANAVIPVEDTEEDGSRVTLRASVAPGQFVRRAGEDLRRGEVAVAAGSELGAGELAVLASVGAGRLQVIRRPQVAIFVTGDELVEIGEVPGPGQIRDSNSVALTTLVAESGAEVHSCERLKDNLEATIGSFEAATQADLIVSSGGVSMGRYDLVRRAVEELGGIDFWKVAMKPGKPCVLGRVRTVPFLGLPGNPVSVHVSFEQFVRPAIRKMKGARGYLRPTITARLTETLEHGPGRFELVRVRLSKEDGEWLASPTGAQGSHIQSSLVDTHGVAHFGADETKLPAGTDVTVEIWRLPEEK